MLTKNSRNTKITNKKCNNTKQTASQNATKCKGKTGAKHQPNATIAHDATRNITTRDKKKTKKAQTKHQQYGTNKLPGNMKQNATKCKELKRKCIRNTATGSKMQQSDKMQGFNYTQAPTKYNYQVLIIMQNATKKHNNY